MEKWEFIYRILKYLPEMYAERLYAMSREESWKIEEIRFRLNCPCYIYTQDSAYPLSLNKVTSAEMENIFFALTQQSPKYFEEQVKLGYISVEGLRVGVSAEVLTGKIFGINIRIPVQHLGVSEMLLPYITKNGRLLNTLIFSVPQMGKTTLARDIAFQVGSGNNVQAKKVCVIDERNEIYGDGIFEIGAQTDVIAGMEKRRAIKNALRSLSPDVIVTDELGNENDTEAIFECINSGVTVCATAHAGNLSELNRKSAFREMLGSSVFDRYVLLNDEKGRITVKYVADFRERILIQSMKLKEVVVC